jgi:hypothetical protein
MSTEGAVTYGDVMQMDDLERTWWLQKCLDHNEEMESKIQSAKMRH